MKFMTAVLLLGASLLLAGSAQAYAIYNHADHKACVSKWYSIVTCHITVDKHSTYNGEHGAGLKGINVGWEADNTCYTSDKFDIPKGGYIRIYNHEVKIYNHHDKHEKTKDIYNGDCKRLM